MRQNTGPRRLVPTVWGCTELAGRQRLDVPSWASTRRGMAAALRPSVPRLLPTGRGSEHRPRFRHPATASTRYSTRDPADEVAATGVPMAELREEETVGPDTPSHSRLEHRNHACSDPVPGRERRVLGGPRSHLPRHIGSGTTDGRSSPACRLSRRRNELATGRRRGAWKPSSPHPVRTIDGWGSRRPIRRRTATVKPAGAGEAP